MHRLLLGLALVVACSDSRKPRPESGVVASEVQCAACSVEATQVRTAEVSIDPTSLFGAPDVAVNSRGRVYLSIEQRLQAMILSVDRSGTLDTVHLETRERPWSVSFGSLMVLPGDTIVALRSNRDILWFDSSGRKLREARTPVNRVQSIAHIGGDGFVVYAPDPHIDTQDKQILVLNAAGEMQSAIGIPTWRIPPVYNGADAQVVGSDGDHILISGHSRIYRIDEHQRDGTLIRRTGIRSDWFGEPLMRQNALSGLFRSVSRAVKPIAGSAGAERAHIVSLRGDSAGLRWVLINVERDKLYSSWIDVIDPARRNLLVRAKLPFRARGAAGDLYYTTLADKPDRIVVQVWALKLVGRLPSPDLPE